MKKIPIFLLTILTMSIINNALVYQKTYAEEIDAEGNVWYSVPELLEYREIIQKEKEEVCKKDKECLKTFNDERIKNDEKYHALAILEGWRFLVTDINPEKETIKIIFFSEYELIKYNAPSEMYDLDLENLYIGWFEGQASNYFSNYSRYQNQLFNNEIPGAHMIFGRRAKDDGANWLPEKNKEVEFKMSPNSDIKKNMFGDIRIKLKGTPYLSMSTTRNYATYCLKAENYNESAGCHLMVSPTKGAELVASPKTEEPILEEENEQLGTTEEEENNEKNNEKKEDTEISSTLESVDIKEMVKVTTESQPGAPETGQRNEFKNENKKKETEIPFWLKILFSLGILTFLWLFWPSNKKYYKKNKKNLVNSSAYSKTFCKKSLDKREKVR